jgi:hypothetical protein
MLLTQGFESRYGRRVLLSREREERQKDEYLRKKPITRVKGRN